MSKTILLLITVVLLGGCLKAPVANENLRVVRYELEGGSDVVNLFGLVVVYTDDKNVNQKIYITKLPWKKEVIMAGGMTAYMRVEFEAKKTIRKKETYNVGFFPNISFRPVEASSGSKSVADTSYMRSDWSDTKVSSTTAKFDYVISTFAVNSGATITYYPEMYCQVHNMSTIPTHYRIGETADLSTAEWTPYVYSLLNYSLKGEHGERTIYVQFKSDDVISNILSSTITYADFSTIGFIGKEHIKQYVEQFAKHIVEEKVLL